MLVARGVDVVQLVVAADVLERRDAEHEVERAVVERKLANICDDGAQPRHVDLREIDAGELSRSERDESGEVGGLRERVTDVEHPSFPVVACEAPRDLDRPLVDRRGRLQEARPRRAACLARLRALRGCERECCVEDVDAPEFLAFDELAEQSGAGERAVAELRERELAAAVLGRAPYDESPGAVHEVLVATGCGVQPAPQVARHDGKRKSTFRQRAISQPLRRAKCTQIERPRKLPVTRAV